ncbi:MAG TPA: helix-turn-helix transcriptional regulator [Thermoanaerobaculia bacterium]|jgi:transcriptional regulator with XRE-family HTH domain|nr:helix-turn-helix transcriptional regulator [Thermoanaerobaculia bacterium]
MTIQRADMDRETAGPPERSRALRKLRDDLGLSQADFARLLGFSTRWVAAQESAEAGMPAERRVLEVERLYEALSQVVKPEALKGWLNRPNQAFDGLKPLEVVERGQIDRLWQMVFFLESGVTS